MLSIPIKEGAIFGFVHGVFPPCLFQQQHLGSSHDRFQQPNCELDSTLSALVHRFREIRKQDFSGDRALLV
jgi:hypothetical protein